jgi:crotonobetainyl-CoA:carnitine CoA-transferase CaiB-like acyl-CoA transferase
MTDQALSHLNVIELSNLVSGPYCSKLLADLGADVIKIEPPGTGDCARRRGPFLHNIPSPELSGLFLFLNTNKLSITLDVTTETGKGILKELIKQADIFIEDNPPPVMEKQELTYGSLERTNPRLVMTSITPFGQTGPYREYKAYELNSHHAGGEGYLLPIHSDDPDREPVKPGGIVGDSVCGLSAAVATLTAVYFMMATGIGQHIDVSKQDVLMSLVQNHVCTFTNLGEVHSRLLKGLLTVLPMECEDGYIIITIVTDREWLGLVECMGNPPWALDEKYLSWANRHWYSYEINPRVQEWVQQFKREELFHRLQAKSVAVAPVNTAEDLAKSVQLHERGFFTEIEHILAGILKYPTAAYQFSRTPWKAIRPAPLLGQDNEQVYCGRLSFSKNELTKLREAGVI